jgi:hypothetical protein
MKVIKTLILLAVLSISSFSSAQDLEPRLLNRMGSNEIEKIYLYRYDYYHFLMFELDNGYTIKTKKELSKDQVKKAKSIDEVNSLTGGQPLTMDAVKMEIFDFLSYSFEREMDDDVIYKLEKDSYVIVYSKQNLAAMYKSKFGTQKRTTPVKK